MRKLKMMFCVMMLPLVVVGCTSKQSVSQCVKPPPPPAWIMLILPSNSGHAAK
ncbi:lysis system o-spanin lipoprotein Rz1 [Escherichia coli]|uniref:lysis system o-spanin lipoprotein Rz1 n=1 Tax=Escherichia coli TaxID=562 RepID=UPI001FF5A0B1|nr:lysis system o-spanin lipoprotein Rz1 [Escherichia coli]